MNNEITAPSVNSGNLQVMLRYLSFALNEPQLRVNISNSYDEPTEAAVRYFQQTRRLPVTGVVDLETQSAISEEYENEISLRQKVLIRPVSNDPNHVNKRGERSDEVLILQIILNALRLLYEYPQVPLSGVYSSQTEDAVREFQRLSGIASTGDADRRTWLRLAEEYNARPVQ